MLGGDIARSERWHSRGSGNELRAIGLGSSLFSGRGPLYSALRQIGIGAAAAGVTYATGALIGVSIA
jgi:hypothetical protein